MKNLTINGVVSTLAVYSWLVTAWVFPLYVLGKAITHDFLPLAFSSLGVLSYMWHTIASRAIIDERHRRSLD